MTNYQINRKALVQAIFGSSKEKREGKKWRDRERKKRKGGRSRGDKGTGEGRVWEGVGRRGKGRAEPSTAAHTHPDSGTLSSRC